MCETHDWRTFPSYLCLICFLLCNLLDIHLHHGAHGTNTTASPKYYSTISNVSPIPDSINYSSPVFPPNIHNRELIKTYGEERHMTLAGLNRLLWKLGLSRPNAQSATTASPVVPSHLDHDHPHRFRRTVILPSDSNFTDRRNDTSQCFSGEEMFEFFKLTPNATDRLTLDQFRTLCPTLVWEMERGACRVQPGAKSGAGNDTLPEDSSRSYKVWGASIAAVLVISLVGLLVVAVVPLMPKSFYNILIQFLIALAIGSLTGDALLHLIPHAFTAGTSHSHNASMNEEEEKEEHMKEHWVMVSKSLVGLAGIYVFFFTERLTILCQNVKAKQRIKQRRKAEMELHDEDGGPAAGVGAAHMNGAGGGASSSFTAPDQPAVHHEHKRWVLAEPAALGAADYTSHVDEEDKPSTHGMSIGEQLCNKRIPQHVNTNCPNSMDMDLCAATTPQSANTNSNEALGPGELRTNEEHGDGAKHHLGSSASPPADCSRTALLTVANVENNWGHKAPIVKGPDPILPEPGQPHPHKAKPHGHHHGHSHDLSSVRAIAYTIIAGDGLHNFCDGIAIGAAFANDLRGGLSTAIAVLCHELPHELGDFAVLLHAGMSVKSAIFYNLLSSVLCAMGMIIGVLVGGSKDATSWIFMLAAGMFFYIALVNMMPELSTSRLRGHALCHRPFVLLFWQLVGMLLGAGIMLIIALYEDHFL